MDLNEQLDELARAADVPAGDLDAVVARARHRQARTRRAIGACAAVALGATALAVVSTGNGDDGTDLAAGGPDVVVDGDLAWRVVDPDSAIALYGRPPIVGDGVVYALSTAPGQAPETMVSPLQVWTSDDGVEWRTTSSGPPTDDLYLSDLDAGGGDGRLYAIGTGQAAAATIGGRAVPELRIGSSDDGETWATETLDVDLDAVLEHATTFSWAQREVATDADGDAVAVVAMRAELDVPELVPAGDPVPERWAITATGVDVLGERNDVPCDDGEKVGRSDEGVDGPHRVWPDHCGNEDRSYSVPPQETHAVERSYTWNELGVSGDLLAATLGQPIAFVARDGGSFERVDVPLPGGEIGWLGLEGGPTGFDLAIAPLGGDGATATAVLHSDDGTTWTSAPLPAELQWITGMGTVGGQSALLGSGLGNEPVVVLADGHVARPAADIDPAVLGDRTVWAAGGAVGDLGFAIVVGLSSERGDDVQYLLLTSRDGRSWKHHVVDDLAGVDVSMVGSPIVTSDRIVVPVVESGRRDADGHLVQRALVATPA